MSAATIRVGEFEGPYDVLLSLIEEQKLSITEISLSTVTEQYLQYIDTLETEKPEELADFLVVATKLLLAKSRMLLPQFGAPEEEGPSLEEQLKLYKQFIDSSKKLNERWLDGRKGAYRTEPARKAEGFIPGAKVTLDGLHQSMLQLVHRLAPPKALRQTHRDKSISVKEKIDHIRSVLDKSNKTEVIVGFLALLEIMKTKTVALSQEEQFGDIMINRVS